MLGLALGAVALIGQAPAVEGDAASAQPVAAAGLNPRAIELFRSDWVLREWGLRVHDRDHDAELSPIEADAGAKAFKAIADGDGDGRVTPSEFRRGREFLLARH